MITVDPSAVSAHIAIEVLVERLRQVRKLKWSPEHDDGHHRNFLPVLATAKLSYFTGAGFDHVIAQRLGVPVSKIKNGGPRKLLIQAAALILAAIEKHDRERPIKVTIAKKAVVARRRNLKSRAVCAVR